MTERGDEMDASPAHKGRMEEEVDLTLGNTKKSLEVSKRFQHGTLTVGKGIRLLIMEKNLTKGIHNSRTLQEIHLVKVVMTLP